MAKTILIVLAALGILLGVAAVLVSRQPDSFHSPVSVVVNWSAGLER